MIQRFQDIDKLKLILLNDNQRKLFECIPKPKAFPKNLRKSEHFTACFIAKSQSGGILNGLYLPSYKFKKNK